MDKPELPNLISLRQLCEHELGVSVTTGERWKAAGKLPRPIELSRGCHRWRLAEVREWIASGCPV